MDIEKLKTLLKAKKFMLIQSQTAVDSLNKQIKEIGDEIKTIEANKL